MPPRKKRAATAGSAEPSAKKNKTGAETADPTKPPVKDEKSRFPIYTDGDVEICLMTMKLKLHIDRLRKTCDHFQSFNNVDVQEAGPIRFCLPPNSERRVDESHVVMPCTHADSHDHTRVGNIYASRINEALFRLLYDQPLNLKVFLIAKTFCDTATLAIYYGCLPAIKPLLVTAILKANLGTAIFSEMPLELLTAAYHLRDEQIFTEAMVFAPGYNRDPYLRDEVLPAPLADLVQKRALS